MAGVAALFTQDFFHAVRARLEPGGLFCQWAHTYDISDADLRSIVATFRAVFPDGTMWLAGDGDLLLVGSKCRAEAEAKADAPLDVAAGRDRPTPGSGPACERTLAPLDCESPLRSCRSSLVDPRRCRDTPREPRSRPTIEWRWSSPDRSPSLQASRPITPPRFAHSSTRRARAGRRRSNAR